MAPPADVIDVSGFYHRYIYSWLPITLWQFVLVLLLLGAAVFVLFRKK